MTEREIYELLAAKLPWVHWQRVETPAGAGIPDVNYALGGSVEGWLELKRHDVAGLDKPLMPKVEPSQIAWLTKRSRMGCRVFIFLASHGEFWLLPGACVLELRHGLSRARAEQLAAWTGNAASPPVKWHSLAQAMSRAPTQK